MLAVAAFDPAGAALAQDGHLTMPDFSALAARASEHTDVSLVVACCTSPAIS